LWDIQLEEQSKAWDAHRRRRDSTAKCVPVDGSRHR